jgi:hypothetical protein
LPTGRNVYGAKCCGVKFLWDEMYIGAKCPWSEMRNVHRVKCPQAKCSLGELSMGRNVH